MENSEINNIFIFINYMMIATIIALESSRLKQRVRRTLMVTNKWMTILIQNKRTTWVLISPIFKKISIKKYIHNLIWSENEPSASTFELIFKVILNYFELSQILLIIRKKFYLFDFLNYEFFFKLLIYKAKSLNLTF